MTRVGFLEVGSAQRFKAGERIAGDAVLTRRSADGARTITVLSDGLGSGVKAGVLSSLTSTMALRLIEFDVPIERVAQVIMQTLPVCSTRHISYSTFTIVDARSNGRTRIIEYDNPPFVFVRRGELVNPERRRIELERPDGRPASLRLSELDLELGDRILCYSDGVTQAGMGSAGYPLGWGRSGVSTLLDSVLTTDASVSASVLARRLVQEAGRRDGRGPRDDISSVVLYYRSPRKLLVVTGPPLDESRDAELAQRVGSFPGRRIVAGGTTGNIVARELGTKPVVEMRNRDPEIPPFATMEGVDLVTEGIITMARVVELLESPGLRTRSRENAATMFRDHLVESDEIELVVGTKINQAHQDPRIPAQFELRRTIAERIAALLRANYLKDVTISYV
ncbi:MAG: SpoIIE family protein phosphatase [Spirochaetota bacterium]